MTKAKVGVQMMVLKNKVEKDGAYETMRRLSEIGFSAVEVSQIPMIEQNVQELKRASRDFNIEIAAISAGIEPMLPNATGETLLNDFAKIVRDCKALGCSYIRMGILPLRILGHKEKLLEFAEAMENMAERLEKEGIKFYYHTHHYEFQKYDGVYLLDLIKKNTKKLGFELDIHWIQRAGENPVKVIRDFKDRVDLLHLKDYRIAPLVLNDEDFNDTEKLWKNLGNIIQFAELGEGNLDLKAMIDAGLEAGVRYFFIEQDDTYGRDPFESLEISRKGLAKLGYSDLL